MREQILPPRLLLDELTLTGDLVAGVPKTTPSDERDPACGMTLVEPKNAPPSAFGDVANRFCSDHSDSGSERGAQDPLGLRGLSGRACPLRSGAHLGHLVEHPALVRGVSGVS